MTLVYVSYNRRYYNRNYDRGFDDCNICGCIQFTYCSTTHWTHCLSIVEFIARQMKAKITTTFHVE